MTLEVVRVIALLLAFALLAAIAFADLALRIIPNRACGALALLALLIRAIGDEVPGALLASSLVLMTAIVCWLRGWIGGGDVKLLAASVLLVSPAGVPSLLADVAFAGGALAICYLILSRVIAAPLGQRPGRILARVLRVERWRIHRRRSIPYACAIASGVLLTLLHG